MISSKVFFFTEEDATVSAPTRQDEEEVLKSIRTAKKRVTLLLKCLEPDTVTPAEI